MRLDASSDPSPTTPIVTTRAPLICIVGYSGTGKTTLMVALVAELTERGFRVGTIKHDAHSFDMDRPGKDSYRHKAAGATASLISSPAKIALVADVAHDHQPEELLAMMPPTDIVLVEGFKRARLPKIEVFRPESGKKAACQGDEDLIAVISDTPVDWGVPRFASNQVDALADFVLQRTGLASP